MDLHGLKAAVLGGDGRETETLRLLQQHGAQIDSYGCPPSAEKVLGRPQASSVKAALEGASIVICPIPYPAADGSLYAPQAEGKVYLTADDLSVLAPNAIVITGVSTEAMKAAAVSQSFRLCEYEHDDDLMILRAAAIAEGAVAIAIQKSIVTIHRSSIVITGFGRTGVALGGLLAAMQGRVTVVARNPVARARAYQMGLDSSDFDGLNDLVKSADLIFNTAPAQIFTRDVLALIPPDTVLIDMSAPPGGVDREAAAELGVQYVWARGLGGVAPRTVAQSQWIGITRLLNNSGLLS
jgi:dipicolinate synthase subunit A